jgi:hypothetical protein
MNRRRFLIQLSLLATGVLALLLSSQFFSPFQPYLHFSLMSLAFFVFLSAGMYFPAAKAAISKDKNAFTRLIMMFTFGKLLLTVVLVIGYQKLSRPPDNFFLLPFFLVYIAFTIFETIFLTKLGKIKAR